ncbi:MAG: Methylated-DNA--protein-cysteine methyltransferase [Firmicutes bacterium]|nr:Methylated-DNA--protein-cysteine methyltransferase [Bacillota bacterium]
MLYYYGTIPSPLGEVHYAVSELGVLAITTPGQPRAELSKLLVRRGLSLEDASPDNEGRHGVARELDAYFKGALTHFTFPLDEGGTAFQRQVWQALREIPYGSIASYRDIAKAVGKARAARAVGQANAKNPLPMVTPCHRVCSADGGLGGFAGGLEVKKHLLALEQRYRP